MKGQPLTIRAPGRRHIVTQRRKLEQARALKNSDPGTAGEAFQQAVSTAEQLYAGDNEDPRYQAKLIHCLQELSVYLHDTGRREEVDAYSQRAGALAEELLKNHAHYQGHGSPM